MISFSVLARACWTRTKGIILRFSLGELVAAVLERDFISSILVAVAAHCSGVRYVAESTMRGRSFCGDGDVVLSCWRSFCRESML